MKYPITANIAVVTYESMLKGQVTYCIEHQNGNIVALSQKEFARLLEIGMGMSGLVATDVHDIAPEIVSGLQEQMKKS